MQQGKFQICCLAERLTYAQLLDGLKTHRNRGTDYSGNSVYGLFLRDFGRLINSDFSNVSPVPRNSLFTAYI